MTDEQAKELMEIVLKEFQEGVIEQFVLFKHKSHEFVAHIKQKFKLDGDVAYGFNIAVDCFEEVMNGYIEELKKGWNIKNDRKE